MNNFRNFMVGTDTPVATNKGKRPYINFDNAASTPSFKDVLQAVDDFAPWYSSVHRGNGLKSRLSTQVYERARDLVTRFFGANPLEHTLIFGKNTTEAINKLARRLPLRKTDIVLISHLEHHSNDLPWRTQATVRRIATTADGEIDKASYTALLKKYGGRVKLVAISGASNVTGHIPDVHWFARQAHAAGAQIMVDCAQLAAHRRISMGALDEPGHLDYIAFSGHKMYAPFGEGALIGRRDTFLQGDPDYSGGGTVSIVTPTEVDWAKLPDKEEAGSPNVVGAVALARAIQTLEEVGLDEVVRHETELTQYALGRLKTVPGLRLYGQPSGKGDRLGVIPFTLAGMPPHLVAAILGYEWGIGVRSGCFCAQPYVMSLLEVPVREQRYNRSLAFHGLRGSLPGMVRISFGLYNTKQEIDVLIGALKEIAQGSYGEYTLDEQTGFYTPVGNVEDFAPYFSL